MTENVLRVTYQVFLPGFSKLPNFFSEDPAYQLTLNQMKQYAHCSQNKEVVVNNVLRTSKI